MAFADALRADTSSPVELYEETVESERFPGADQARVFTSYLTNKYAGRKIDVIVARGLSSLSFTATPSAVRKPADCRNGVDTRTAGSQGQCHRTPGRVLGQRHDVAREDIAS